MRDWIKRNAYSLRADMMMNQGQGNPMMVQLMGQRQPQPGPTGVGPQQGMMVMSPQQAKMRPQMPSQQPPNAIVRLNCEARTHVVGRFEKRAHPKDLSILDSFVSIRLDFYFLISAKSGGGSFSDGSFDGEVSFLEASVLR